jgi:outer membrane protein assembly factor BamB
VRLKLRVQLAVIVGTLIGAHAWPQGNDWMTTANDAQRSSWVRTDPKISVESVQKPGFGLAWKLKPENTARQLNTLMPAVFLDFYIGYRGFRALGFFGASADRLIAIDTELGRLEWEKDFSKSDATGESSATCPGGMTSAATRPTTTAYPIGGDFMGFGRGSPAKSGVGLPDQGAVTLKPEQAAPRRRRRITPAMLAASPYAPRVQYVMALTGDGYLHSLWVSNGNEPKPPVRFLPPGAHSEGLIVYGDTAYVATTNGCGGVEDGIWALDLPTDKVSHWKPESGGIAGSAGPAAGPDGTLYVTTTQGELAALEPKTLKRVASQKVPGVAFTSSPVVFDYKGKNFIGVASNEARIYLFEATALAKGTPPAKTPAFSKPGFDTGSLTTWLDRKGDRWILAAAGAETSEGAEAGASPSEAKHGAIVAWKVVEAESGMAFQPGWVSRDMTGPLPPVVTNGVVFALSSGEFHSGDAKISTAQRVKQSKDATLYAFDGETGKELWNSGETITSFVHSGRLSAGETRIYLATYDGTEYAFGIPIEH